MTIEDEATIGVNGVDCARASCDVVEVVTDRDERLDERATDITDTDRAEAGAAEDGGVVVTSTNEDSDEERP